MDRVTLNGMRHRVKILISLTNRPESLPVDSPSREEVSQLAAKSNRTFELHLHFAQRILRLRKVEYVLMSVVRPSVLFVYVQMLKCSNSAAECLQWNEFDVCIKTTTDASNEIRSDDKQQTHISHSSCQAYEGIARPVHLYSRLYPLNQLSSSTADHYGTMNRSSPSPPTTAQQIMH